MELTWICPGVLLDGLISSNTGVLAERRFFRGGMDAYHREVSNLCCFFHMGYMHAI